MVGNILLFGFGHFVGQDGEAFVDLHDVGVDNLAIELFCEVDG